MDKKERRKERFDSRVGMILAMAGSAVGLGNLWRFPFLAAQNGGGAFIFVYLILLLTICIPVLMTPSRSAAILCSLMSSFPSPLSELAIAIT